MNKLRKFFNTIGEDRGIENIPPERLNQILCEFFMTTKRNDGSEFEPGTLSSFQKSFQRFLSDSGSNVNIKKGPEFELSRKVLAAKRKEFTLKGFGNKPNATRNLESEEVDTLFEKGFFVRIDLSALQRTICWFISLHFGFRVRDESKKLKWSDMKVEKIPRAWKKLYG